MCNINETNNNVVLIGTILTEPEFNHYIYNEGIYQLTLRVKRSSGIYDDIPICISERLIDLSTLVCNKRIKVEGRYSSYNLKQEDKISLLLYVFANQIDFISEGVPDENVISLYGSICKPTVYRKTPLGREISDVLIAINRSYGKSDYIPVICWGRNAKYVSRLEVGSLIHIDGRIQSRLYEKNNEKKMAYEVSVGQIYINNNLIAN